MGLDSVELIMEVEKAFNINIPDEEAEQCITVGALYETVARHAGNTESQKCTSQMLFYRLRRNLGASFNLPIKAITPSQAPEALFPKNNRRQVYSAFAADLNLQTPALELPKPLSQLLTYFGLSSILGGLVLALILINFYEVSKWSLLIPLAGIIVTSLLSRLLTPFRTVVTAPTLRRFTEQVLILNYASLTQPHGINRKEMELVINQIIMDKTGVEMEEIAPDKKFCDDLGID